ncbi:hypothetical protein EC988_002643 [Linderina pennispora]|nr:hypothetical protein EC988_002643 [Linderina pennispora]
MPSSSPKPSIDAGLDYGSIVSDEHFELEMGRGQSPSEVARRMFEREEEELQLHNIELDIPWLNPGADEMARRRVSVSMRTESSPGVGSQHGRSHAASVQSTPSRLSSLDPPSADELEVQEFELTADMPAAHRDIGAGDDGDDDLDGFLDIRNAGSEPDMPNDDSRKFYHFVVSRISRAGTAQFGDLVQAPHNKRRVAARAFMDLLQMATRSVLHVYQASPYSGIEISIEKEKNGWK